MPTGSPVAEQRGELQPVRAVDQGQGAAGADGLFQRRSRLERGKVVESGTHQELLAMNGAYKNLYELQFNDPQP